MKTYTKYLHGKSVNGKAAAAGAVLAASLTLTACGGGDSVSWASITDDASAKTACKTLMGVSDADSAAKVYTNLSGKDAEGAAFDVTADKRPGGNSSALVCEVTNGEHQFTVSFTTDKSADNGDFNEGVTVRANGFVGNAQMNTMSPNVQDQIQDMVNRLSA